MYHEYQDMDAPKQGSHLSSYKMSFNMIKSTIGIGLLSIPFTLKNSGWLFLVIMAGIASITYYNAITLGTLVRKYTREVDYIIDYPTLGRFVYGNKCEKLLKIIWSTEIYMVSLIMISLAVTFLHQIRFLEHIDKIYIELIVISSFTSFSFIRDYSKLSFISLGGLCSIGLLVILVFVKFFTTSDLKTDTKIIDFSNIPSCIGISLFSFGGHVIFPEIFDTLKEKENLNKVITRCWGIITVFTMGFAVLGFTIFGEHTFDSIVTDLEKGFLKDCLLASLFVNLALSFPLTVNPLLLKIECVNCILLRVIYMGSLFLICHYWESFIQMMGLTGIILENATSLIFPPLLILKVDPNMKLIHKIINISIVVFGIITMIIGFVIEVKKF
jgi:vesicular inhibitory amino acid transporter